MPDCSAPARRWHWDDLLVLPLLGLLRLYRRFLSPLLGQSCRFEPSCSHYATLALQTHSLPRALRLVAWRLARCQPFGRPGDDPVPPPTRLWRVVQADKPETIA